MTMTMTMRVMMMMMKMASPLCSPGHLLARKIRVIVVRPTTRYHHTSYLVNVTIMMMTIKMIMMFIILILMIRTMIPSYKA